ncbi:MAG: hypothetical protein K6F00_04115 [Lachnospiraceae bacterium]|nr:hypothetical protein [Lachnospiraceae bacterium]
MDANREVSLSVSSICRGKDGRKYAYVKFEDGKRTAEGRIPACHIDRSEGFMPDEIDALEVYMRENINELKKMASNIHVIDALF